MRIGPLLREVSGHHPWNDVLVPEEWISGRVAEFPFILGFGPAGRFQSPAKHVGAEPPEIRGVFICVIGPARFLKFKLGIEDHAPNVTALQFADDIALDLGPRFNEPVIDLLALRMDLGELASVPVLIDADLVPPPGKGQTIVFGYHWFPPQVVKQFVGSGPDPDQPLSGFPWVVRAQAPLQFSAPEPTDQIYWNSLPKVIGGTPPHEACGHGSVSHRCVPVECRKVRVYAGFRRAADFQRGLAGSRPLRHLLP
ncbi:hypothetical protein CCC_01561 [Paramagnetospirillum magnetotacticum MS-1]|uniref:Uncharacterized protein n=1 Tax=Paramagnetospirillum magnetotacticum MS-1 TaxID=272627 RepID=A0A0C2YPW6_PARME|nr:hypothetical protein CCC_01561 [Paramagnetospirillum magnetotacticum MS-1]